MVGAISIDRNVDDMLTGLHSIETCLCQNGLQFR